MASFIMLGIIINLILCLGFKFGLRKCCQVDKGWIVITNCGVNLNEKCPECWFPAVLGASG